MSTSNLPSVAAPRMCKSWSQERLRSGGKGRTWRGAGRSGLPIPQRTCTVSPCISPDRGAPPKYPGRSTWAQGRWPGSTKRVVIPNACLSPRMSTFLPRPAQPRRGFSFHPGTGSTLDADGVTEAACASSLQAACHVGHERDDRLCHRPLVSRRKQACLCVGARRPDSGQGKGPNMGRMQGPLCYPRSGSEGGSRRSPDPSPTSCAH